MIFKLSFGCCHSDYSAEFTKTLRSTQWRYARGPRFASMLWMARLISARRQVGGIGNVGDGVAGYGHSLMPPLPGWFLSSVAHSIGGTHRLQFHLHDRYANDEDEQVVVVVRRQGRCGLGQHCVKLDPIAARESNTHRPYVTRGLSSRNFWSSKPIRLSFWATIPLHIAGFAICPQICGRRFRKFAVFNRLLSPNPNRSGQGF